MDLQNTKSASHWARIGPWHHRGFCLPLSALHTAQSGGIGEFLDLIPFISWCKELHMDIIQLLPLNDTGFETSPYNLLSSCALHPIYLSLHALPYAQSAPCAEKLTHLTHLNAAERVAWAAVLTCKMDFLSLYFVEHGQKIIDSQDFLAFVQNNSWLKPYALFKALQSHTGQAAFFCWPDELKYTAPQYDRLLATHASSVQFHCVLQYLCYTQLSQVKRFAQEQKVLLKGDLPLLINANSADVWFHPELFNLDLSVGVPPDMYSAEGQNWGLPGFHWMAMKADHFSWWKQRLRYAESFYDLYRIDHAVGLFRLFAIPQGLSAKEGHFIPADANLWGPHGEEILEIFLKASPLLPIAEDLGIIPDSVRTTLKSLGIPSTKCMRWEKNWEGDQSFLSPLHYIPASMTCLSTHDSPTLEQWWRDFPQEASAYALQRGIEYTPKLSLALRKAFLLESNSSSSLFHINLLSEYLALLPEFVSSNPDAERINIPGTVSPTNWTYKFRRPLEEMISSSPLKQAILSTLPQI